jgi:hypothetical protein
MPLTDKAPFVTTSGSLTADCRSTSSVSHAIFRQMPLKSSCMYWSVASFFVFCDVTGIETTRLGSSIYHNEWVRKEKIRDFIFESSNFRESIFVQSIPPTSSLSLWREGTAYTALDIFSRAPQSIGLSCFVHCEEEVHCQFSLQHGVRYGGRSLTWLLQIGLLFENGSLTHWYDCDQIEFRCYDLNELSGLIMTSLLILRHHFHREISEIRWNRIYSLRKIQLLYSKAL